MRRVATRIPCTPAGSCRRVAGSCSRREATCLWRYARSCSIAGAPPPDLRRPPRGQVERLEDLRAAVAALRARGAQLPLEPRDQPPRPVRDLLDLDLREGAHDALAVVDVDRVVHDLGRGLPVHGDAERAPQCVEIGERPQFGSPHVGGQQAGEVARDDGAVGRMLELEPIGSCGEFQLPQVAPVLEPAAQRHAVAREPLIVRVVVQRAQMPGRGLGLQRRQRKVRADRQLHLAFQGLLHVRVFSSPSVSGCRGYTSHTSGESA